MLIALFGASANAAPATEPPSLELARRVVPGAEGIGPFVGEPPAAAVMIEGRLAGYLLSTRAVVGSVGYSGRPFEVVVGLNLDGRITGAQLVAHNEPVLVIGVAEEELQVFIEQFRGLPADTPSRLSRPPERPGIDAISGATVSSVLFADAILRAARAVAESRGLISAAAVTGGIDQERFVPMDWPTLVDAGLISRLRVTNADVSRELRERGRELEDDDASDETFVDLYAALATPAMVGRNLLGDATYLDLTSRLAPDQQAIVILASGRYSVKGTRFARHGVFERLQVLQGEQVIPLTSDRHVRLDELAIEQAPTFREAGWFGLPADSGFEPTQPWLLRLIVERRLREGELLLDFVLPVTAPTALIATTPATEPAGLIGRLLATTAGTDGGLALIGGPWLDLWVTRATEIVLLLGFLLVLTQALVFQDALVQRQRLYRLFRLGFLLATVLWLGFALGAQLSVVNVLTFIHSLLTGFSWQVFLIEPLIFILWCYVALAMLFLGRGVFCGWLCPFGALQELGNRVARRLKLPQLELPFGLHERLWPIKYIVFLGLLALSLQSMTAATVAAEVEPFKTAIVLTFVRDWPFVVYALLLLGAGLFIERFYCRYLCPLGAALAIPARLSTFRWLKRRPQCGRECRICAVNCPVQAIHPSGEISPNECIYCLDCQTHYFDDRTCPPLIKRRKRREMASSRAASSLHQPEPAGGGAAS